MDLSKVKATKAEAAKYMESEINHNIRKFGKRGPGDPGERQAVEYMAERCKEYGCEQSKVESFDLHPAAFMGWIYITATVVLASFIMMMVAILLPTLPALAATIMFAASIALILIGAIIMIAEFVLYRELVDKIYPKKTSCNLTATKKPTGEIKRRLFYNGHPDAACEWTLNYLGGGVLFVGHIVYSMIGLLLLAAIAVCALAGVSHDILSILIYVTIAFVPAWILLYILWNEKIIVDGANDNLTGCYMGIAVLKALKDQGIELEHTEVGVLISGSEEAGLRGAKAWCKAHPEYSDKGDVETLIISFDTIHEGRFLQVNQRDLNLTVKANVKAGNMFKAAADKVGVTCNLGNVPLGATDSAAFNQAGFKATGITAMDHNLQDYYHTRKDTIGNLDLLGLADCFATSVQFLEDYENEDNK
ncbi:MAG: M20/M25/M40 family metallo-hydrolase [Clostridia bacterium]